MSKKLKTKDNVDLAGLSPVLPLLNVLMPYSTDILVISLNNKLLIVILQVPDVVEEKTIRPSNI